MSWKPIKEKVYELAGAIVAGGDPLCNYNWQTIRREDTYIKSGTDAYFTLRYPQESTIWADITRDGDYPADSQTQIIARECEFVCTVKSDMGAISVKNAKDLDYDALDKAADDITGSINIDTLSDCGLGILGVEYGDAVFEANTSQGAYFPYDLVINVRIIFSQSRSK